MDVIGVPLVVNSCCEGFSLCTVVRPILYGLVGFWVQLLTTRPSLSDYLLFLFPDGSETLKVLRNMWKGGENKRQNFGRNQRGRRCWVSHHFLIVISSGAVSPFLFQPYHLPSHPVTQKEQKMQVLVAILLVLSLLSTLTQAFYNSPSARLAPRSSRTELHMGGKMSKFGIFSPAVYGAKLVLGEAKLNKLRGKAISLHSQAITAWCQQYGAYNLRLKLVSTPFLSTLPISVRVD